MNNLKKLGLTALAGSLVAVSAQAGELSVSGSAAMAYAQASGNQGSGIGTNKAFSLAGSGELDNGWTFSISTALTDAIGLSSSTTALTMGSLGTITLGEGHGGNSGGWDEEVPQAYEQVSDAGPATAMNYTGSWLGNGAIGWALPSLDTGVGSLSVSLGFSPDADNLAAVSDGTKANHGSTYGNGMDAGVKLAMDNGLTLGAYGATRENITHVTAGISNDAVADEFNGTWFATYAAGPVSIGYQVSHTDSGLVAVDTATTAAKVPGTAGGLFDDTQMSILFNVNDNLSVSYTDSTSTYDAQSVSGGVADVDSDLDALQVAYSMGGMSINAYMMSASNPGWDSDASDVDTTEVSIGLAF